MARPGSLGSVCFQTVMRSHPLLPGGGRGSGKEAASCIWVCGLLGIGRVEDNSKASKAQREGCSLQLHLRL